MKRDDSAFLEDILERVVLIESFVAEGREAFLRSRLIQEAVLRCLEIIGEASRSVSQELRDAHPEMAWRQAVAFRNFAIHTYWDVNPERVWQIVENDLPALRAAVQALLVSLPPEDAS